MSYKPKMLATLAIALISGLPAGASEITRIIDTINATFSGFYAPKQWKEKYLNWNLSAEIERVNPNGEELSLSDFHKRLKHLFQSTRDYHTSIRFANNATSTLPISIKYINGKYYLAYIDAVLAGDCGLRLGDQITHLNDKEIGALAYELMGSLENPTLTDWALAGRKLTKRIGTAGDLVEKGSVVIKALRSEKEIVAQMVWLYNPNQMSFHNPAKQEEHTINDAIPQELAGSLISMLDHIKSRSMVFNYGELSGQLPAEASKDPMALAQKKSFLPSLGEEIWRAPEESMWDAYIFLNAKNQRVGFIRIASFMPEKNDEKLKAAAEEFGQIVAHMNDRTDLLVIDQLNNPGGSIFYLYALASMLTDKPLRNPRHQFIIDSKEVFDAQETLKQVDLLIALASMLNAPLGSIHGYPIDVSFLWHMRSYYQFMIEQWEQGKGLTEPSFLFGVDYIKPHPLYRYTKKIIVLTNELDFSAGDFFAAIMQDNERASLLGTTTAGAGGYVLTSPLKNRSNIISYSYTGSLAYRANGQTIENLGVTPEIHYQISQDDLKLGFNFFKSAISEAVEGALKDALPKLKPKAL